jgi:anti-sigma B factor antagonist
VKNSNLYCAGALVDIKQENKQDVGIFSVAGRLDSSHSKELDFQLIQSINGGTKKMVLDLHKLEYISSAGIRVLVHCLKEIEAKGGELFLAALPKPIENVLYITGFAPYFKTFETLDRAVEKFKNR